jgi:putative folate metabolism gamma-glutamate ligase
MQITAITTDRIVPRQAPQFTELLDSVLTTLPARSILAITSKIVAICEGRVVAINSVSKDTLIQQEADRWLPRSLSRYDIVLSIKNNRLIPTAGIDESNSGGFYVLWPANPQGSANQIHAYLQKRFNLRDIGVIITDSTTVPLRTGTIGIALAHSGFQALRDYIGQPDLFDRPLKVTKANLAEGLAAAAVLAMGEGNERTPLAIITDLPNIIFQNRDPNQEELAELAINPDDDLYAPLLKTAPWQSKK